MYMERRLWHWVDWALFGIFTSWLGMGLLFVLTKPDFSGSASRYGVMAGMLLCYFAPLAVWRPGYINRIALPVIVLATGGALELYMTWANGEVIMTVLVLPLLIVGFHSVGRMIWVNIFIFLIAIPIIEFVWLQEKLMAVSDLVNHMLNYTLLFLVGYGIQRVLQSNLRIKKLYEENLRQYRLIQEQNKALEQYANQVEKLTLLEERNRLAQELHDTVGHTFTSVIMGMDAVSYLMDMAPDKAKEKLDVLRNVTRNGLEEVRRSIHQIAPQTDEGTLAQQLTRLANEFAVHTGTKITFEASGEECDLPKQSQLTLIRCLQESLTNAKRHGQASQVRIVLDFQKKQLVLNVEDDGLGSGNMEAGFGLTAMRERLAALQGTLQVASSSGNGTTVTCFVPLQR